MTSDESHAAMTALIDEYSHFARRMRGMLIVAAHEKEHLTGINAALSRELEKTLAILLAVASNGAPDVKGITESITFTLANLRSLEPSY